MKLWWSQFHKFWKLWNCASQFVMFVKLWFAHFEFWKPLKNLSFAMNGFEESYYTIPKSNISRLKIYNCSLRSIFFKIFSKIGQILETKIVLFTDFTIFHNLWNCEGPWNWIVLCCDCDACSKNQIVLCCEIVSFHNHNFTISQIHNFILQLWAEMLCHRRKSALVLAQLRKNVLFLFLCISFCQYLNRIFSNQFTVQAI